MKTAYAYSRFSSASQGRGDTMRRQLAAAASYADEHGLILDCTLQDHGLSAYSGANRERGALALFLERMTVGDIQPGSYLLIDSFDRLTREAVTVAVNLFTSILLNGVTIVTLSDRRTYDRHADLMDIMFAVMSAARSHEESRERGRKISAAFSEAKRRAREDGTVWSSLGPTWLILKGGVWEPRPDRTAIVRRIFDRYERGDGAVRIAQDLNDDHVPPPRASKAGWYPNVVLNLLRNRSVLGEYQPHSGAGSLRRPDGPPIPGFYPAVISIPQFERVRRIAMRSALVRHTSGRKFPNILRGMIWCSACGGSVGIVRCGSGRNRGPTLACLRAKRLQGCTNLRAYDYRSLEEGVLNAVKSNLVTHQAGDPFERIEEARARRKAHLERRIEFLLDLDRLDVGSVKPRILWAQRALNDHLQNSDKKFPTRTLQRSFDVQATGVVRTYERLGSVRDDALTATRRLLNLRLGRLIDEIVLDPQGCAFVNFPGAQSACLEVILARDLMRRPLPASQSYTQTPTTAADPPARKRKAAATRPNDQLAEGETQRPLKAPDLSGGRSADP